MSRIEGEDIEAQEGWVWPSEAEVRAVGEHELWDEAMERIEAAPKPNRAQRREQARRYMGRETRQQLHGFGRWRKRSTR